jgi:phenylpropionate dioxygenase-like ring-hydroxylating dioxygenase large terminal subunit
MTIANYPRNCWYVAATSEELSSGLLARTLLDRPVVLYRDASGAPVALEDRCVHRGFPLSEGRLDGDRLICGYHGFTYDTTGACVRIPAQPNVPAGVCVHAFPVLEAPPFVWIWMGDPGASTLSRPPTLPWLTDPAWATSGETGHIRANYLLLHEHYLDLSHMFEVHPAETPPGIESLPAVDDVEMSETSVSFRRTIGPAKLAEWEAEATGLDRDQEYERRERGTFVSPAIHVGRYEIDSGAGSSYAHVRVHAFTPETPASTHVFMQVARDYATDRTVITNHLKAMFERLAAGDIVVLERLQARVGVEGWTSGVHVNGDTAALKARAIVARMLANEAGNSRGKRRASTSAQ